MPKYAKRSYKTRKGVKKYTKGNTSRQVMVNRMPKISKSVIAPKFFTSMEASFMGSIDNTGVQSNDFAVSMSNIRNPFSYDALSFTSMTGASLVNNSSVLIQNIAVSGFNALATLYNNYRVHSSTIKVTFTPAAAVDYLEFVVVPCQYNIFTMAPIEPTTYYEAKSMPYSKFRQCTGFNDIPKNTIVSTLKNRTIHGLTKEQYRTDMQNSMNQDNSIYAAAGYENMRNAAFWKIWYAKYNAGTFTNPVSVSVTVRYYVEWFTQEQNLAI